MKRSRIGNIIGWIVAIPLIPFFIIWALIVPDKKEDKGKKEGPE